MTALGPSCRCDATACRILPQYGLSELVRAVRIYEFPSRICAPSTGVLSVPQRHCVFNAVVAEGRSVHKTGGIFIPRSATMSMSAFPRGWFAAAVVGWMVMQGAHAQTQDVQPVNTGPNPYRVIRD